MNNKKGLMMGRLISTFPVLILIFLLLIIYLLLSGLMFGVRRPSVPPYLEGAVLDSMPNLKSLDLDDILRKDVSVSMDGEEKRIILFYAIKALADNRIKSEDLKTGIKEMLRKESHIKEERICLVIAVGKTKPIKNFGSGLNIFETVLLMTQGDISSLFIYGDRDLPKDSRNTLKEEFIYRSQTFIFNNDEIQIDYYYGNCEEVLE